eukprot:scaffold2277_cov128-Skeletonema_marinoi.AAC.5
MQMQNESQDRVLFLIASAQLWPTLILIPTLPSLSGRKERLCPFKTAWMTKELNRCLPFYPSFSRVRFTALTSIEPFWPHLARCEVDEKPRCTTTKSWHFFNFSLLGHRGTRQLTAARFIVQGINDSHVLHTRKTQ